MFLSDDGPTLETLNFTFCILAVLYTPTFHYFDFYLNTRAYVVQSYSRTRVRVVISKAL